MLYKAEHSVDLETEANLSSHVTFGDRDDTKTGPESVILSQVNLNEMEGDLEVKEVVMDKGYHSTEMLAECATWGLRSYLPEPKRKRRKWRDKAPELEGIYRANRRRTKGNKGRKLNRKRSEYCERTFAHVCQTGGSRRTWLRGLENVVFFRSQFYYSQIRRYWSGKPDFSKTEFINGLLALPHGALSP